MQCRTFTRNDKHCPRRLASLPRNGFDQFTATGNLDLLADSEKLITGLFCSRKCPGSLILSAFDHVAALRDAGRMVASGFHSEMEQECLKILLRGTQPVIICPARAIENMRVPKDWEKPMAENRLLVLSTFDKDQKRTSAQLAGQRNRFVASLVDEILVIHAKRGTETLNMAVAALKNGKRTLTIKNMENQSLLEAGAVPLF